MNFRSTTEKFGIKRLTFLAYSGVLTLLLSSCSVGFLGADTTATGTASTQVGSVSTPIPTATPTTSPSGVPAGILISGTTSVPIGQCEDYTLTLVDAYNNDAAATANTIITVSSTNGIFYSDAACTVVTYSGTIATGQTLTPIYWKSSTTGGDTLLGSSPGLTTGSLPVTVGGTTTVGVAAKLSIIGSQQEPVNSCAGYVVSVLDVNGNIADLSSALAVSVTGGHATYYSDANCTIPLSLSIAAGQAQGVFYFKDATVETVTMTASGGTLTPGTLAVAVTGSTNGPTGFTALVTGTSYVGTCLPLTIETVNASGVLTPVTSATTVQLVGSNVAFFADAACTQSLAPTNQTTIPMGSDEVIVYIEGQAIGTATITISSVPAGTLSTYYYTFTVYGSSTTGGTTGTTIGGTTTGGTTTGGTSNEPVITDVILSALGLHYPDGPGSASGYSCSPSFTDCGGAEYLNECSGLQAICAASSLNYTQAVLGVWLTPNGTHTYTLACPNGYAFVNALEDCFGGLCMGYQSFCKAVTSTPHGVTALEGISVSQSTGAGICPSGWSIVGTVTGSQTETICVRSAYLP